MKIRKIFFILVAITLFTLPLNAPTAFAGGIIKVGDLMPYSEIPSFTAQYKNGWELALNEVNKAGGIYGKKLEIISRNDGGSPDTAIRAANELLLKDKVSLLMGGFLSNIGLAISNFAKRNKILYIAGEPLSDALVWSRGNHYTFRLRPSTYMLSAMLAEEAAKNPAKRWATIAPNYAYGKGAVKDFEHLLKLRRPNVKFVAEQWPALFKINAGDEIQALRRANPQAIYNVEFGSDLTKFIKAGKLRGFFKGKFVVSLLTGEPEYLDPLKGDAPVGWLVTGYPWYAIHTKAHDRFLKAYEAKYHTYPRMGSVVGYSLLMTVADMLKKAHSTDTEKMIRAMEGLKVNTPFGAITFRKIDHQSTLGTYVGYTALKNGKGIMIKWKYDNGKNYLPSNAEVRKLKAESDN